jgi:hypothetical protein
VNSSSATEPGKEEEEARAAFHVDKPKVLSRTPPTCVWSSSGTPLCAIGFSEVEYSRVSVPSLVDSLRVLCNSVFLSHVSCFELDSQRINEFRVLGWGIGAPGTPCRGNWVPSSSSRGEGGNWRAFFIRLDSAVRAWLGRVAAAVVLRVSPVVFSSVRPDLSCVALRGLSFDRLPMFPGVERAIFQQPSVLVWSCWRSGTPASSSAHGHSRAADALFMYRKFFISIVLPWMCYMLTASVIWFC